MRATAAPEQPLPPTFPAPLSIPLAPRTSKKKVTPNLGGCLVPSQQMETHLGTRATTVPEEEPNISPQAWSTC